MQGVQGGGDAPVVLCTTGRPARAYIISSRLVGPTHVEGETCDGSRLLCESSRIAPTLEKRQGGDGLDAAERRFCCGFVRDYVADGIPRMPLYKRGRRASD